MSLALMTGFAAGSVPRWVWWLGGVALVAGALGFQELRIAKIEAELATAKGDYATAMAERAEVARQHAEAMRGLQAQHAADQQEKEHDWNMEKARLVEQRRVDAATAGRLRDKLAAFTARGRSAGQADPAAGERAADRLEALGRLFEEGVELVVEGRGIVERRDAEVKRLVEQVRIDRAACDPGEIPREKPGVPGGSGSSTTSPL